MPSSVNPTHSGTRLDQSTPSPGTILILNGASSSGKTSLLRALQALLDERLRGRGYGRALMEEAERIGREHGCTFAHTTTFSYQAPDFYQAVGYTIFAAMDDYPDGIVQYFLKKSLKP